MTEMFRSYMGPGDKDLPRGNEVQGYQPVSRIGEVVMNAFIDAYEHQVLTPKKDTNGSDAVPMFHEWATVQPGMLTLARKKRTAQYRQFHAAETAMPARTRPFERRNRASALHRRLTCTPSFSRSSRAPSAWARRTRRTSFSVRRSNFAPPPVHASDSCLPSLHSRRVPKQERARARRRRGPHRG